MLHTRVRLQLELQKHRKNLEALVEDRTSCLNAAYDKLKAREEVTLNMLAKATDLRDHDIGGHIERTTEFVCVIVDDILNNPCPGYDISRSEADDMIRSSKLYDLGMIALPDHVLLKPGLLDIRAGSIPAGKVVFCMYRGPYTEMEPTYGEMAKWIRDNGYTPVGTAYEQYYNGPEFPESEMLTKIVMPIE